MIDASFEWIVWRVLSKKIRGVWIVASELQVFLHPFSPSLFYDRNLYNFSPKHFFSDSSGAYWRERRLKPGMYTDGETVFEASYRYRDGRNGMHKVSTLKQFLSSSAVPATEKESIMKKLKEAAPDVVLEL